MSMHRVRALIATVAAAALVAGVGAVGTTVRAAADQAGLAAVGPVSGANGFPVWYEDKTGVRVGLCLDGSNPLCGFLPGDIPDPDSPVSFPSNYPDEAFYLLAGSGLDMANGGRATLTLGLEAAFANAVTAGDQMVFGRVRVRITDAAPDAYYVVFHPYGTDVVQAEPDGRLFVTEDIGTTPGQFTEALDSRIGPFLAWDADAPAGYLGDPDVEHTVTGSPVEDVHGAPQNYFKVVGPLAADPGAGAPTLVDEPGPATDLFTVQGKLATDAGVTGVAAYYAHDSSGPGSGDYLDVFATSDPGQAIDVVGQAEAGFGTTLMAGGVSGRRYHARLPLSGPPPASVRIVNTGDSEPTPVDVPVTDGVTVTDAQFDADARTLTVSASSTDAAATLHANGFGDLTGGTATFTDVDAAPGLVRVTSSSGGSDTAAPVTRGTAFPTLPPIVSAGADRSVPQGTTVTLRATMVQGDASSFSWQRVDVDPAETVGSAATVDVTAPDADTLTGPMRFVVTATGPGGTTTDDVEVTVTGVVDPVADAGPDQVATRNATVRLDASASSNAVSYAWTQLSGPPVVIDGAGTAAPSFRFPRFDAATYPDPTAAVVVQLTATGLPGTIASTDTVSVAPAPADTVVVTAAQYRRGKREWRIEGTSSLAAGQTVKAHRGASILSSPVIGSAAVDNLGAWRIRLTVSAGSPSIPAAGATTQPISVESGMGGVLQGAQAFPATVTN